MRSSAWLLLLLGCSGASAEPKAQEPEPATSVRTPWIVPESAEHVAWLEAPARVLPSAESYFAASAPLAARVLRVRVHPGQTVRQDEPLVDVLSPDLLAAAGLASAANLRIAAYEARQQRLAPLVQEGLARSAELSELEANLALARAERERARATLRIAGLNEGQVSGLLAGNGTLTLRAPISAMVVSVSARPGDVREPASGPLVELAAPGQVQIEARLAAPPPQAARFVWLADGESRPLTLEALSPRAAPEDGSRTAWLRPTDAASAPVPMSVGRVLLLSEPHWRVLPITAVHTESEGAFVLSRRGEAVSRQAVSVVLRSTSEVIVTDLPEGLLVAADFRAAEQELRL